MIRSMAFLPGNTPNMLINGDSFGADALILDLEDAVAPSQKDSARILVRNYLRTHKDHSGTLVVRINSTDTDYWREDLQAVLPERPDCILPTKVDGADMIRLISREMEAIERACGMETGSVGLMPLLETAMGIEQAFAIASASPRVKALVLGGEDLTADLHSKRTKEGMEILYARTRLVCAARAARVEAIDTPFTDVNDMEGLRADAAFAKGLGFGGKLVISPRHIDTVNEVFSPSQEEIDYAREVLHCIAEAKENGLGVVALRGKMIDAPIVARARQVVDAARTIYGDIF